MSRKFTEVRSTYLVASWWKFDLNKLFARYHLCTSQFLYFWWDLQYSLEGYGWLFVHHHLKHISRQVPWMGFMVQEFSLECLADSNNLLSIDQKSTLSSCFLCIFVHSSQILLTHFLVGNNYHLFSLLFEND